MLCVLFFLFYRLLLSTTMRNGHFLGPTQNWETKANSELLLHRYHIRICSLLHENVMPLRREKETRTFDWSFFPRCFWCVCIWFFCMVYRRIHSIPFARSLSLALCVSVSISPTLHLSIFGSNDLLALGRRSQITCINHRYLWLSTLPFYLRLYNAAMCMKSRMCFQICVFV